MSAGPFKIRKGDDKRHILVKLARVLTVNFTKNVEIKTSVNFSSIIYPFLYMLIKFRQFGISVEGVSAIAWFNSFILQIKEGPGSEVIITLSSNIRNRKNTQP